MFQSTRGMPEGPGQLPARGPGWAGSGAWKGPALISRPVVNVLPQDPHLPFPPGPVASPANGTQGVDVRG